MTREKTISYLEDIKRTFILSEIHEFAIIEAIERLNHQSTEKTLLDEFAIAALHSFIYKDDGTVIEGMLERAEACANAYRWARSMAEARKK